MDELFDVDGLTELNEREFGASRRLQRQNVIEIVENSMIEPEADNTETKTKGVMQSDIFDVAEISKINEDKKLAQHKKLNLEARKSLKLPYFQKPKTENDLLINYQYEYLKNNNQEAWGKLIDLSFKLTEHLLYKWIGDNKVRMDEIEQSERVSIAVFYVLRRYETRIGYYITNFVKALNDGVKHAMLYITKLDMETDSLEELFPYSKQERLGAEDAEIGVFK